MEVVLNDPFKGKHAHSVSLYSLIRNTAVKTEPSKNLECKRSVTLISSSLLRVHYNKSSLSTFKVVHHGTSTSGSLGFLPNKWTQPYKH